MRSVKFCPRCGGTEISIPPMGLDIVMSVPDYCHECEHRGTFPVMPLDEIPRYRKRMREKPREGV